MNSADFRPAQRWRELPAVLFQHSSRRHRPGKDLPQRHGRGLSLRNSRRWPTLLQVSIWKLMSKLNASTRRGRYYQLSGPRPSLRPLRKILPECTLVRVLPVLRALLSRRDCMDWPAALRLLRDMLSLRRRLRGWSGSRRSLSVLQVGGWMLWSGSRLMRQNRLCCSTP